jgi:hypothetical protein
MATFNVSFLNPALQKSSGSGAGILADQLSILENSLAKDGYLSPGDYDILIAKAREIQMSGLTADQRSNYDVKISGYERAKSTSEIDKTDDISRMNKILNSEGSEDIMVAGNNPREFLKGRMASIEGKLNELSEIITRRENSGLDTTDYYNEYNSSLQEYQKRAGAFQAMGEVSEGLTEPISGYVAYVETNANGEIVNVDYARYGEKSGYAETNGMIDGFQVFGKVNSKKDGENYFKLGNQTFSAADMLTPDPNNPGSFKPNKLMANVQEKGVIRRAQSGYVNMSQPDLRIQDYLPNNSWAKGNSGTIYKKREDGGYTKYLNATPESLNIQDSILNMPEGFERSLMNKVDETVDVTAPIAPDQGMGIAPSIDNGAPMQDQIMQGQVPTKMNYGLDNPFNKPKQKSQAFRTPQQPSAKVDGGAMATAKRTIQSGVDSIKRFFS